MKATMKQENSSYCFGASDSFAGGASLRSGAPPGGFSLGRSAGMGSGLRSGILGPVGISGAWSGRSAGLNSGMEGE
jgi:hypothetical protein